MVGTEAEIKKRMEEHYEVIDMLKNRKTTVPDFMKPMYLEG